jgi:hypothetical protein
MSNYLKPLTQTQYKCSLKAEYFDFLLATFHSWYPQENCIHLTAIKVKHWVNSKFHYCGKSERKNTSAFP